MPCTCCGQLVSPARADVVRAGYQCDMCAVISAGKLRAARRRGALQRWIAAATFVVAVALTTACLV